MILKFLIFGLFIGQYSLAATIYSNNSLENISSELQNESRIETARNLNSQLANEQSVKLLNYNLNNYLANMNRMNGQNRPTNSQILAAAASLINANNILINNPGLTFNPSLVNPQTLSSLLSNGNFNSTSSNNQINMNNNLNQLNRLNVAPSSNLPIHSAPLSDLPMNNLQNNVPSSPVNNAPVLPTIVSNSLPTSAASTIVSNKPINQVNAQSIHNQNRNMINNQNNANKEIELNNEDPTNTTSLVRGSNDSNYLTFNGENGMPEHWRLLINGMQKFSLNLIKSLHNFEPKDSSTGIILSPFSIWSTLIVTFMGAKTETEREMADVLHLKNIPKESVLLAYRGLKEWYDLRCRNMNTTKQLNEELSPNQKMDFCSLANKVFFNSNLKLNKFLRENFGDETESLDFVHDSEKSRQAINNWIEKKTKNKIKNLIASGSINSFTNVIVANAIYFQAKWLTQFETSKTIKGKFQVNPTEEITVNYMRQTANFMYGISENIKSTIIELPYSNQEFSMVLILPSPQLGIDSLIKQIKVEHLEEIFMNLYDDEVEVQIPKFKFEQEFELAGPLYSMGMRSIFDPRFSDFSGFLEIENKTSTNYNLTENEINDLNNNDLFNNKSNKKVIINSVVHKAFISVDEDGTEAAAATATLIARSGRPAFPSQFIANRPFLFLVRDTTINAISFMGIVRRPSSD